MFLTSNRLSFACLFTVPMVCSTNLSGAAVDMGIVRRMVSTWCVSSRFFQTFKFVFDSETIQANPDSLL